MMTKHNCKNCNAPLKYFGNDLWKCEYCGTIYDEIRRMYIETVPSGTVTNKAVVRVEPTFSKHYPLNVIEEQVLRELVNKFADALVENMEIHKELNLENGFEEYHALVRFVKPNELAIGRDTMGNLIYPNWKGI